MTRGRVLILLMVGLIAAAASVAIRVEQASAGPEVCTPCVVLIEVDGLEPKDVTPETTPFLWALAHPNAASSPTTSGTAVGAAQLPAISGRAGWTWEAARGAMTATTAASTASLLTGGYPQRHGIYANDYFESGTSRRLRLGGSTAGVQAPDAAEDVDPATRSLVDLVGEQTENKAAAFLGDPKLLGLFGDVDADLRYAPESGQSVPLYCPVPETSEEAAAQAQAFQSGEYSCPTTDAQVVNEAQTTLAGASGGKVTLAFLHLAELGAVKRLYGDPNSADTSIAAQDSRQEIRNQLIATDAAVGALITKYQRDQPQKWDNTVLFVVGNHGYETTPQTHRVPDPANPSNPAMGIEQVVKRKDADAKFIPQGTIGTVYTPDHDPSKLKAIADEIMAINTAAQACTAGSNVGVTTGLAVGEGCVKEVLVTGGVAVSGYRSVEEAGYDWRLHAADKDGKPTGADGDLLVVTQPGWATGAVVPLDRNGTPNPSETWGANGRIENPYVGSAGGPRNRAIAAIVNGKPDIVKQVESPGYPAYLEAVDEGRCPETSASPTGVKAAATANADPAVADLPGHECQAEIVDVTPTIAALLRISMLDTQLDGRFLQEAFNRQLGFPPADGPIPSPPVDPPPPPPEPDVQIPPPPPPPEGFDYDGLLRGVKATVVDENGCTWETARPGAVLDYLKIEGDFGRSLSAATLTFYKRKVADAPADDAPAARRARRTKGRAATVTASASKANRKKCRPAAKPKARAAAEGPAKRPPLEAIARFDPFALKRGHVVLNLKIPELYKPSHVGLFVQEARRLDVPKVQPDGSPGLTFEAFGAAAGQIVRVVGADRLHDTKPKRSTARSRASKRSTARSQAPYSRSGRS